LPDNLDVARRSAAAAHLDQRRKAAIPTPRSQYVMSVHEMAQTAVRVARRYRLAFGGALG
jgi:hypothetical protein